MNRIPGNHRFVVLALLGTVALRAQAEPVHIAPPESGTFTATWDRRNFSHDLFSSFLADCVNEKGLVDYAAARKSEKLAEYIHRLSLVDPSTFVGPAERKAFWINAYNALAIYGVCKTLPAEQDSWGDYSVIRYKVEGFAPGKGFFGGLQFTVGARLYTLDEIENQVLMRRWEGIDVTERAHYQKVGSDLGDPRLHFALVCCATGCPPLRRAAYFGRSQVDHTSDQDELGAQLDEVTGLYFNDPARNKFDQGRKVWKVSELLRWFESDFSNSAFRPVTKSLPKFASPYLKDTDLASSLWRDSWQLEYYKYDWSLNIQKGQPSGS